MNYLDQARSIADASEISEKSPSPHKTPVVRGDSKTGVHGEKSEISEISPRDEIAQRERWDMTATVAAIVALSDEKRAVYRAALAFDTEALQRADAILASKGA